MQHVHWFDPSRKTDWGKKKQLLGNVCVCVSGVPEKKLHQIKGKKLGVILNLQNLSSPSSYKHILTEYK